MADSKLVNYEDYTSNKSNGRGGNEIVYIAVHHMAGNLSVETCGRVFHDREASAHYGIDNNGRIGQYVSEKNTAWSLGNFKRNQQSINIELANDNTSNWHVSDKVIEKCIDLLTDICKRLGWTYLSYTGNLDGDLIMHRWVVSTACPGDYLASKFPYIADEVTKRLKGQTSSIPAASNKIAEDGVIGAGTITAWQKIMKSPYTDGEISDQKIANKKYVTSTTSAWEFNDGGGSTTVKTWQKFLISKGFSVGADGADGFFGKNTALATQKFLVAQGISVGPDGCDSVFGHDSSLALQKWINKNL